MKIELVRIGNSRGIRIPKPILEQCGFRRAVELRVEKDRLVIFPERRLRQDWEAAFRAAGPSLSEEVMDFPANEFDSKDWRW